MPVMACRFRKERALLDGVAELLLLDSVVNFGVVTARVSGAADGGWFATFPATRGDNARYVLVATEGRCETSWYID